MYGVIFDVISVPNPINVAYTSVELPPHMDLWYTTPLKPSVPHTLLSNPLTRSLSL